MTARRKPERAPKPSPNVVVLKRSLLDDLAHLPPQQQAALVRLDVLRQTQALDERPTTTQEH